MTEDPQPGRELRLQTGILMLSDGNNKNKIMGILTP